MGQYYMVVNTAKKECLKPTKFGDGAKLMEFGLSKMGMMSGLAILLADGNGRGGGDLRFGETSSAVAEGRRECIGDLIEKLGIVGRWKGDPIVIAGDYADGGTFVTAGDVAGYPTDNRVARGRKSRVQTEKDFNLYSIACGGTTYRDISIETLATLMCDSYVREEFAKDADNFLMGDILKDLLLIHGTKPENLVTLIRSMKTDGGRRLLEKLIKE